MSLRIPSLICCLSCRLKRVLPGQNPTRHRRAASEKFQKQNGKARKPFCRHTVLQVYFFLACFNLGLCLLSQFAGCNIGPTLISRALVLPPQHTHAAGMQFGTLYCWLALYRWSDSLNPSSPCFTIKAGVYSPCYLCCRRIVGRTGDCHKLFDSQNR